MDFESLKAQAKQDTQLWVEKVVIGLNLCPFAAPVVQQGQLRLEVSRAKAPSRLMKDLLREIFLLTDKGVDEVNTTLLIHPMVLTDFEEYLDFVAEAEEMMEENGISEEFQLATFHPDYYFDDVAEDDPSNFTNRSPYPMLHLLREAAMSDALANHPDPEGVPDRNVTLLREMGTAKILNLLAGMNHPALNG